MKEYIFTARDGVHVIDLALTVEELQKAQEFVSAIAAEGGEVLFVGTKRQAAVVISSIAEKNAINYLAHRWLGGLLTNFDSVKTTWGQLNNLAEKINDEKFFGNLSTREQFKLKKEHEKLEKLVGGLKNMERLPDAVFVVDVKRERTAVEEAKKMGIPVIAIVDTNVDPELVDFPIPGNDDALKSIEIITGCIAQAYAKSKKK